MLMLLAKGNSKANWLWGPFILFMMNFTVAAQDEADVSHGMALFDGHGTAQGYAVLQKSHYKVTVRGLISFVEVEQQFVNPTSETVNGKYQFPLPDDSAVFAMIMKLDDREIVGQIKEKQRARKVYQKAQQAGHKAALVEQRRDNVFSTAVANLEPGQQINVTLKFQHQLDFDDDIYRLRLPMLVAPRYSPVETKNVDPILVGGNSLLPFAEVPAGVINSNRGHLDINLGLELQNISSSSHRVSIVEQNENQYAITIDETDFATNRDFELAFKVADFETAQTRLFKERVGDESYYMLMMTPASEHFIEHAFAREMIFVIDTSGSMYGESLAQAKEALINSLMSLATTDSFNVIEFNSATRKFSPTPRYATYTNISEAVRFVRSLQADGGTEINKAFNAALTHDAPTDVVRQVIFLTDGSISNETAVLNNIQQRLGSNRIFTIGIGSAPNAYFMRRAARIGRGSYTFINRIDQVAEKITGLNQDLAHPALKNIDLKAPGSKLQLARSIPDLYFSKPMFSYFKLDHSAQHITFTAQGEYGQIAESIMLTQAIESNGIARMFAREKIAGLHWVNDKTLITETALKHQLMSPYTSFVAVQKVFGPVANKTALVESMKAKGSAFPQTGGNSKTMLLISLMLFLSGLYTLRWAHNGAR